MTSTSTTSPLNMADESKKRNFYFSVWRWHFYAGLYVIPFILLLSVTGLIMLFNDSIEQLQHDEKINITPQHHLYSVAEQRLNVQNLYPNATIKQYITPVNSTTSSRFSIVKASGQGVYVLVNPYTGAILGEIDRDNSWYRLANDIHGTLLLGDAGDRMIEIAASLSILLIVSGLYLWWPKDAKSRASFLTLRFSSGTKAVIKDLHSNLGAIFSLFLLFFLISGLAWAGVWGGKFVQPWSSFPAEKWDAVPLSTQTHNTLNHGVEEEVPWNLELTHLPLSTEQPESSGVVNVDRIVELAYAEGFTRFKLNFPKDEQSVYTVSANTMSGDITDARDDRTTHIDQYSGKVLADVTWQDYSVMAKFMAAGIALHQGDMGLWNLIANTLLCGVFIFIAISGVVMWWSRKPNGLATLASPIKPKRISISLPAIITVITLCLLFPMAGMTIATILLFDLMVIARSQRLQKLFH
jgi:uncharacterized iron-regulated membrane protein